MIWNPWKEIKRLRVALAANIELAEWLLGEDKRMHAALRDIEALETPKCSRGVQKAVNIAREALGK